jgi:RNA polymerase sigma-70 factor, ECF subfamily
VKTQPSSSVWLRTQEGLIARIRESDANEAWEEFYQTYCRVIYNYARRFGLSNDDAEDIVQEVFVKIMRKLPSFHYDRSRGRFLSWIKTITRTTATDFLRRRQARIEGQPRVESPEGATPLVEQIPDPNSPDTPDPWHDEWRESLLKQALSRVRTHVDVKTFRAFVLCAFEGRQPAGVARALGMSTNSVYVAKSRVLRQLKREVEALRSSQNGKQEISCDEM